MKRATLLAVIAVMSVGGCMTSEGVTGRSDNDVLRFSAMSYTLVPETIQ